MSLIPLLGQGCNVPRQRHFLWRADDTLNLLPYRPLRLAALRRRRWLELLCAAGVGLVTAFAVGCVQRAHQVRTDALAALWAAQLHALDPALQEHARLSGTLAAARQRTDAQVQLALARDDLFYLLNALQAGAGHGVALDQVDFHAGHATLKGRSADRPALSAWTHALTQAVGVDAVAMIDIRALAGDGVSTPEVATPSWGFTARIDLNPAAPRSWPDVLGAASGAHSTRSRARKWGAASNAQAVPSVRLAERSGTRDVIKRVPSDAGTDR